MKDQTPRTKDGEWHQLPCRMDGVPCLPWPTSGMVLYRTVGIRRCSPSTTAVLTPSQAPSHANHDIRNSTRTLAAATKMLLSKILLHPYAFYATSVPTMYSGSHSMSSYTQTLCVLYPLPSGPSNACSNYDSLRKWDPSLAALTGLSHERVEYPP